ncbi:MAG TPA: ABC transporter permease [Thermoanaerobaculia bacterium]|nr:ABC transporter permease [Thermoanaerobaculia bacterium]
MRPDHVFAVARREYMLRIRGKAFWLSTLGLPLFIAAATIVPSLLLSRSPARERLVIVDETGKIAGELRRDEGKSDPKLPPSRRPAELDLRFEPARADRAAQDAALDGQVLAEAIDAWIRIDEASLASGKLTYRGRSTSNFLTQELLERRLTDAVRRVRLREAGLDPRRADDLLRGTELETVRVSATGNRREVGLAGAAVAYIIFLMLFVAIQIWGQQVMTGVLEEKSSRIVEVLVSAVKPFDLMLGKLLGICAVGLTQFGIWIATAAVVTAGPIAAMLAFLPEGVSLPPLGVAAVFHLAVFFVLGFLVFASLYAALGAAFNDIREAQQMAGPLIIVLMVPVFLAARIINDPDSPLSIGFSLVPLFAPLLMALRIAIHMPPAWQVLLSEALTAGFVLFMVWACARIYRVGILMYGKKPTLGEIARWVRRA